MRRRWALTLPAVQPPPYLIPTTYHVPLRPTTYYAFWKQVFFLSSTLRLSHSWLKRAPLCAIGLTRRLLPCPAAPPLQPPPLPLPFRTGTRLTCSRCGGPRPAAFFSSCSWDSSAPGAPEIRNPDVRSLATPRIDCPPCCSMNWRNCWRTWPSRLSLTAANPLPLSSLPTHRSRR